jgi:hypothetical protein
MAKFSHFKSAFKINTEAKNTDLTTDYTITMEKRNKNLSRKFENIWEK